MHLLPDEVFHPSRVRELVATPQNGMTCHVDPIPTAKLLQGEFSHGKEASAAVGWSSAHTSKAKGSVPGISS